MDDDTTEALAVLRLMSPSPVWHELSLVVSSEQELIDAFEVRDLVDVSIVLDRSGRYDREVFLEPAGVDSDNDAVAILVGMYGVSLQYPFTIEEFDNEIREHIWTVTHEYEDDGEEE